MGQRLASSNVSPNAPETRDIMHKPVLILYHIDTVAHALRHRIVGLKRKIRVRRVTLAPAHSGPPGLLIPSVSLVVTFRFGHLIAQVVDPEAPIPGIAVRLIPRIDDDALAMVTKDAILPLE